MDDVAPDNNNLRLLRRTLRTLLLVHHESLMLMNNKTLTLTGTGAAAQPAPLPRILSKYFALIYPQESILSRNFFRGKRGDKYSAVFLFSHSFKIREDFFYYSVISLGHNISTFQIEIFWYW